MIRTHTNRAHLLIEGCWCEGWQPYFSGAADSGSSASRQLLSTRVRRDEEADNKASGAISSAEGPSVTHGWRPYSSGPGKPLRSFCEYVEMREVGFGRTTPTGFGSYSSYPKATSLFGRTVFPVPQRESKNEPA